VARGLCSLGLIAALAGVVVAAAPRDDAYLHWSAKQAQAVGTAAYKRGRVGGLLDGRLLKTERAYNYKLAAGDQGRTESPAPAGVPPSVSRV
jgi:hypothetical protein